MNKLLRVGVPIPTVQPTAGGAYELEHAIFAEVLNRYYFSSHTTIKLIPLTKSLRLCSQWNINQEDCLVLKSTHTDPLRYHKKPILRHLRSFARRLLNIRKSNGTCTNASYENLIGGAADVLWSINPTSLSTKLPFIITVWDLQHRLQPFFPEVSEIGAWSWQDREDHYRNVATKAFLCVVGTQRGSLELTQFFGIDPSSIIVNPFPCPEPLNGSISSDKIVLSRLKIEHRKYLLYPAQFWSHKNHLSALTALQTLTMNGTYLKLVLPGSDQGCFDAVHRMASSMGLGHSVVMPGFLSRNDLAALYRHCLCLVYPSFFGPDNIPPLEAMSYAVPALVASVPGSHDQFGESVLYFDPFDPQQLALAVQRLIDEPTLKADLVRKGLTHIRKLTPAAYVDKIELVLLQRRVALQCCSLMPEKNLTSPQN